jgi:hypothetical protein
MHGQVHIKLNGFICGKADVRSLYTNIKVSNVDARTPFTTADISTLESTVAVPRRWETDSAVREQIYRNLFQDGGA